MSLIPKPFRKLTFKKVASAIGSVAGTLAGIAGSVENKANTVQDVAGRTEKNLSAGQPLPAAVQGAIADHKLDAIGGGLITQANIPVLLAVGLAVLLLTRGKR